jgi:queuine tRNA-ribosyltransferase
MSGFGYTLVKQDLQSGARAGVIHTPHGDIPTPAFAPVGTQASVKTVSPDELRVAGANIILSNTYHLYLRPGSELIERLGGLHRFMNWDRPILTDSGGFQIFSLKELRRFREDGVVFRSHIDGSEHLFTPERAVLIQEQLGADIIMCLDECAPPLDYAYNAGAMQRTHRWAERCRAAQKRPDQALFGIVQGGIFADLRAQSADFLVGLDFPGYAIGGLSVGEPKEDMHAMLDVVTPRLPAHRPRYLMGVGSPEDFVEGVARGVDLFDCVLPTRIARNAALLTAGGRLNIRNAQYAEDERPIEEGCGCYTCRSFSRAYLRHLFKAGEILGLRLATIHNLYFELELMRRIRQAILDDTFAEFRAEFLRGFRIIDHVVREANRERRRQAMAARAFPTSGKVV